MKLAPFFATLDCERLGDFLCVEIGTTVRHAIISHWPASSHSLKSMSDTPTRPISLQKTVSRIDQLIGQRNDQQTRMSRMEVCIKELEAFLSVADRTTQALETLGRTLFEEVLGVLETNLTRAIQEVLGQPIHFKSNADFKRGAAAVSFSIERDGNSEDVLRGQGGSVQNVLSVGLRMFALATLDPGRHRQFLVLDEQDCWLRPELVPRLVNIVHRAARDLGFQVLMISHHDVGLFEKYADRIYRLRPVGAAMAGKTGGGVEVRRIHADPETPD